jgi:hypothetical protein
MKPKWFLHYILIKTVVDGCNRLRVAHHYCSAFRTGHETVLVLNNTCLRYDPKTFTRTCAEDLPRAQVEYSALSDSDHLVCHERRTGHRVVIAVSSHLQYYHTLAFEYD